MRPYPGALHQRPAWSDAVAHPVRTFHTVRHLRPRQVVYRALRLVQPLAATVPVEDRPFLLPRRPSPPAEAPRAFDGRTFSFLNRRIPWGGPDRWYPDGADDLWVFNLHYFRYLHGLDGTTGRYLVSDWIDANRDRRQPGWHPYPISLRVREWIEWLLAHPEVDGSERTAAMRSIAAQVESLRRRIEFDVMGNHLLENAITLCWAGLSLAGAQAERWLREGAALLSRELQTQLLADGTHQERSPMYQALLAEACLRLAEVAGQSLKGEARALHGIAYDAGRQMMRSLSHLVHPDGGYALVNDTVLGVAPSFRTLERRFGTVTGGDHGPMYVLPAGGYAGYRDRRSGGYLVFDGGAAGPDHQTGHGHADTLSFELSAHGARVVTDTGAVTYASGAARRHDRSTAAHNTIEVDDRDQAEFWGAFRCGRRFATDPLVATPVRDGATYAGGYRGPGRRGSVTHRRRVTLQGSVIAFSDTVRARGRHHATLRVHFAPALEIWKTTTSWAFGERRHTPLGIVASEFEWVAATSPYHPEFGREIERPCLCAPVTFRDGVALKWWLMLH